MTEDGKPEFLDVFCLNFYGLLVFLCVGAPNYPGEYNNGYVRLYELKTKRIKGKGKNGGELVMLHGQTNGGWFYNKKIENCLLVDQFIHKENNCSHPPLKIYPTRYVDDLSIGTVLPINVRFNDKICQEVDKLGLKSIETTIVGTHYAIYIGGIGDNLDSLVFEDKIPSAKQDIETSNLVEWEC